jgi:hypothetical protein
VRDRGQLGCHQPQHDQPGGKSSACSTHGVSIATGAPVKLCPAAICRPADNAWRLRSGFPLKRPAA